ncbi:unnamed protein product [Linum tenue]|uniref:GDSL esterase/lipase n=1 Tax=Linum tenue TaxID=586396 RepID=A0AAV0R6H2_9ROSI|nr:unnamed protein product [Linum tenue]
MPPPAFPLPGRITAAAVALITILVITATPAAARPPPPPPTHLPKFTAAIIFGDSTVDTGNNNYITTAVFKADHLPYGENFPSETPTGRFSDGRLIPDLIASRLAIKPAVPPYLDPQLPAGELRTGVAFASSGSGYDEQTPELTFSVSMGRQVEMFEEYVVRLRRDFGDDVAEETVGGALILVSAGTNDFSDNYYNLPTRRLQFNMSGYQDFLLQRVEKFVKDVYAAGGRTLFIAGLPPIGCLPIQMSAALQFLPLEARQCIQSQNADSRAYNEKLKTLLHRLEASLPDSVIAYADVFDPILDMVSQPQRYGFVEAKRGCCGSGLLEGAFLCTPLTPTCGDLSAKYVFFDSIHPSEAANKILTANLVHQLDSHYAARSRSSVPNHRG